MVDLASCLAGDYGQEPLNVCLESFFVGKITGVDYDLGRLNMWVRGPQAEYSITQPGRVRAGDHYGAAMLDAGLGHGVANARGAAKDQDSSALELVDEFELRCRHGRPSFRVRTATCGVSSDDG